jgi:hypothetical protein
MATRLYFDSSGAAEVSPAFDANWDDTNDATRLPLNDATGSAFGTTVYTDNSNANRDDLIHQWVSPALDGAVSFAASNTLKVQMRCDQIDLANNLELTVSVRVAVNDGTSFRGTILTLVRDGNEMAAGTLTNRQFTGTTGAVSAQDGDRLVVEIGTGGDPQGGGDHDTSLRIGSGSGSDLAENDTSTTDNNPWIEFVENFTFQVSTGRIMSSLVAGGGLASYGGLAGQSGGLAG